MAVWNVMEGDCRELLRDLAARGVRFDSVVTDPPYHLQTARRFAKTSLDDDNVTGRNARNRTTPQSRLSRGFMGMSWDGGDIAFQVDTWRCVFDVLKPGAHLLAFGGSRTAHRVACAIEDAGFEIRDTVYWMYGTGFAKSWNLNRAEVCECEEEHDNRGMQRVWKSISDVPKPLQTRTEPNMQQTMQRLLPRTGVEEARTQRTRSVDSGLRSGVSGEDDRRVQSSMGRRQLHRAGQGVSDDSNAKPPKSASKRLRTGAHRSSRENAGTPAEGWRGSTSSQSHSIGQSIIKSPSVRKSYETLDGGALQGRGTCPICGKLKKEFTGYGSALKPAVEPIILARKPLDGTILDNVLKYGTGAINIKACEVPAHGRPHLVVDPKKHIVGTTFAARRSNGATGFDGGSKYVGITDNGRFPANLVTDGSEEVEDAFARFGNRPGMKQAVLRRGATTGRGIGYLSTSIGEDAFVGYSDDGSAMRFYYSAKATDDDRKWSRHPTVKPLALMHWLIRLITPPGGVVLDPFAGSGTTLQASVEQGFNAVGCEITPEYVGDIERRMLTFCAMYNRRDPFKRERRQLRG